MHTGIRPHLASGMIRTALLLVAVQLAMLLAGSDVALGVAGGGQPESTGPQRVYGLGLPVVEAILLVEKTLPVTVLPTDSAMNVTPQYASTINIHVPAEQVQLLAAYGVAERVFLAPVGWTGSGATGVDGSAGATLRPHPGSPVARGLIEFQDAGACWGCAVIDAAKYFSRVHDHWEDLYGPPPQLRPLVRRVYLTPNLIAYQAVDTQDGLEVNGVVYSPIPANTLPRFTRLEVALPRSYHGLATTILNFYGDKLR